jgi:hypothetical protein
MVLDEYNQVYFGKANNIRTRIPQHWTKTLPFDRTLYPLYNKNSIMSIDSFRALDTTRIYVWKRNLQDGLEDKLIKDFPMAFRCNRIGGDVTTGIEAIETSQTHMIKVFNPKHTSLK